MGQSRPTPYSVFKRKYSGKSRGVHATQQFEPPPKPIEKTHSFAGVELTTLCAPAFCSRSRSWLSSACDTIGPRSNTSTRAREPARLKYSSRKKDDAKPVPTTM